MKKVSLRVNTLIIYTCVTTLISQSAWAGTYTVKSGDTLSEIIYEQIGEPIYGKKGNLKKILALNPILITKPDRLRPGQIIELGNLKTVAAVIIAKPARRTPAAFIADNDSTSIQNPVVIPVENLPEPKPAEIQKTIELQTPLSHSFPKLTDEVSDQELELELKAGYGAGIVLFKQTGAFANVSAGAIVLNIAAIETGVRYGDAFGLAEFSSYSLNMGTNWANPAESQSKSFQRLGLKGGYKIFYVGVEGVSAPVFRAGSGTTLHWGDITSLSAVGGVRLESSKIGGKSGRRFGFFGSFEAGIPLQVGSATAGLTASGISGYSAKLQLGCRKAITSAQASIQIYLGLSLLDSFGQIKYIGTWSGSSGDVKRTIQDYQSLLSIQLGL